MKGGDSDDIYDRHHDRTSDNTLQFNNNDLTATTLTSRLVDKYFPFEKRANLKYVDLKTLKI